MSNATTANVRDIRSWAAGTKGGSLGTKTRLVELHGITAGGSSNLIPATAFGFRKIEESSVAYLRNQGSACVAVPNHDGTYLHFYATPDASTGPGDVTLAATPNGAYLTVKGY